MNLHHRLQNEGSVWQQGGRDCQACFVGGDIQSYAIQMNGNQLQFFAVQPQITPRIGGVWRHSKARGDTRLGGMQRKGQMHLFDHMAKGAIICKTDGGGHMYLLWNSRLLSRIDVQEALSNRGGCGD